MKGHDLAWAVLAALMAIALRDPDDLAGAAHAEACLRTLVAKGRDERSLLRAAYAAACVAAELVRSRRAFPAAVDVTLPDVAGAAPAARRAARAPGARSAP